MLRGALGGAAVALALPPLEAMLTPAQVRAGGMSAPPFFGVFFWANGVPWHAAHGAEQAAYADVWTPPSVGAGYAPSELLMPLMRHRPSIATGLTPHTEVPASPGGQSDGHMRGFMVAMTGDRIRPEGFDHPSHTLTALRPSIDQVVARDPRFYSGAASRFRSLHVSVSGARFHDYGHWNAISYNGPGSNNLPVTSVGQLYGLLFDVPPDADETLRRARLLDAVREDAASLRVRLGTGDRARLDEHLDHLAEIGRRLESSTGATCMAPAMPTDGDLSARASAMASLLAVAVRCDLTRCFTFMLTSPASTHVFSDLGVPDGLHKTCHDGHWDRVRTVTRRHMEIFAQVCDRFEEQSDPMGGTLMDRAVMLGLSEYGEGWKHSVAEMPALLVGGGAGALARGVHVREPGGNYAKVHMTALRALGLDRESWGWNGGQTSEHLSGILV